MAGNESLPSVPISRGRPPGRPRKQYRSSGRHAANAALTRPPLDSLVIPSPEFSPGAQQHISQAAATTQTSQAPVLSEHQVLSTEVEAARRKSLGNSHPASLVNNAQLFLNSLAHSSRWRPVAIVRTLDLLYWFDMQMNDYGRGRYRTSNLIKFDWFGHPGDSPLAANTRRFLVQWVQPSPLSGDAMRQAILNKRVVHRWRYQCTGTCSVISPCQDRLDDTLPEWHGFENAMNEDSAEIEGTEDDQEAQENIDSVSRDDRCSGRVQLLFEIRADNLGLVHIYQHGYHDDASPRNLGWSKGMRNEVLAAMMDVGAQPRRIYQKIVLSYRYPDTTSMPPGTTVKFPTTFPEYRRPSRRQVNNLLPALKRRGRLDEDPFRAMDLLAKRNPSQIYNYTPHDYQKPDKELKFTCALTSDYALESLILHGTSDGLGMDTSWQNKNENRAGLTILVAVDTNGHLTPGAVLLSANIKAHTLSRYLQETERKVITRAQIIVNDPDCIRHRQDDEKKQILLISKRIFQEQKWDVHKWMIDKCKTSLQAILQFQPAARVYICQFHIVQAIQRLQGDSGRVEGAPRLPYRVTYKVIRAFRRAQRCRSMAEWPSFHKSFMKELWDACCDEHLDEPERANADEGSDDAVAPRVVSKKKSSRSISSKKSLQTERYRFLVHYFDTYWFNDRWLRHVTDMSLPRGGTRDGSNNTNNWAESAFLVFDKVFLDMRKNKRCNDPMNIALCMPAICDRNNY